MLYNISQQLVLYLIVCTSYSPIPIFPPPKKRISSKQVKKRRNIPEQETAKQRGEDCQQQIIMVANSHTVLIRHCFVLRVLAHLVGEGNGTALQYSCLENPMGGGAWWAAVHGVTNSQTRLSDFTFTFSLSCIGEGNGNPLQCSCLENPRSLVGCCLWGRTELDTTEATQQQQQSGKNLKN